jgi:signal transduction histidine kinase
MQQAGQTAGFGGAERTRVEAVVETLATLRSDGENLAEVAHDARNMVTALGLYCDLLQEPGVLAAPYAHYGSELRLVAAASRRLVEKLVTLDMRDSDTRLSLDRNSVPPGLRGGSAFQGVAATEVQPRAVRPWDLMPAIPIDDMAGELLANRNLLAALAGPAIALTVDAEGGRLPVRLTGEDLTRVLVNLVKNAAEAMPSGGRVQLSLREQSTGASPRGGLLLTVNDSGPGVPVKALDKVFEAGFSSRNKTSSGEWWGSTHRGLGLSITRSIIEAAGGRIVVANSQPAGASFRIELPVRTR